MREEIIRNILGERYEEDKEVAEKVIRYLMTHREDFEFLSAEWEKKVIEAISLSLEKCFSYPLVRYLGHERTRAVMEKRMFVALALRERTRMSGNAIGKLLNRDYATFSYYEKTLKNLLSYDPNLRAQYEKFTNKLDSYL